MDEPDYFAIPPAELLKEAHDALDQTGNVMAHGAKVAPDYTMRMLIAMRERLNRHQPLYNTGLGWSAACAVCGDRWPCADVRADFKVLAVGEGADG